MKTLISALIFLAMSVALVSLLNQGNGYVLFGYGAWTVEGSLAFFILLDLLLFLLLYLVIRSLARIWSMPERLQAWNAGRQAQRARNALANGLMDLAAGKWKSAEKKLLRHVGDSDRPQLNYLGAARTAHQQGAVEKRDNYLQLAYQSAPAEDIAITLTQAELQLASGQLEQALATLIHLRQKDPKHTYVLKLLMKTHRQMASWSELQKLLPEIQKRDVVSKAEFEELELQVYVELLQESASEEDGEASELVWRKAPRQIRNRPEMVLVYAKQLAARGSVDQAERLIKDAVSNGWDQRLVEQFGLMDGIDIPRQLKTAESWLQQHQLDPVLLLALARICLRGKLWGKARSYLEASIGAGPSAEAHLELGMLLEQMGETDLALENFRAGLDLGSEGASPRNWIYDGRKSNGDNEAARAAAELKPPIDAPLPVAGDGN